MSHIVRPRASPSPCTQVCRMDPVTNLCVGCGRTLSEIADWGSMSDAERAAVREKLPERQERLKAAPASARHSR